MRETSIFRFVLFFFLFFFQQNNQKKWVFLTALSVDRAAKQGGFPRDAFRFFSNYYIVRYFWQIKTHLLPQKFGCVYSATRLAVATLQSLFFLEIIRQPGCANLIESRASLQSLHGCKLNTVACVELTYGHVA